MRYTQPRILMNLKAAMAIQSVEKACIWIEHPGELPANRCTCAAYESDE
jgi:hypothetical protein